MEDDDPRRRTRITLNPGLKAVLHSPVSRLADWPTR